MDKHTANNSVYLSSQPRRSAPKGVGMASRASKTHSKPSGLGYKPRAFVKFIELNCSAFNVYSESERNHAASILWAMMAGRMTHNSGRDDLTPIHWRPKAEMFGSAARYNEINAALGWFELELEPIRGKSAGGWAMTAQAKKLAKGYLESALQYARSGLEDEQGLVDREGKPYRIPADGIRSRNSDGGNTRYARKQIQAAIEIDGDNLHAFHHAAQAWLDGDAAPSGFEWTHDIWTAIRDGRGPNSGADKAYTRARMARDQASIMLDLAKRSGAPGYVISTTYRESAAGRLYAEGAINLQRCVGEVRRAALSGCYDVDIENCHWALVAQMAARLGIATPHIAGYLANKKTFRAQVAAAAGISIDDAKFVMLATIYGATLSRSQSENKRAIEERIGADAVERLRTFEPVLYLFREVNRAGKAIIGDYAERSKKAGVLVNDAGREIGLRGEAREKLAHILQGAESCALEAMLQSLKGQVALLQHDGLTIHGEPDIQHLEREIFARTGYRLTLEVERL